MTSLGIILDLFSFLQLRPSLKHPLVLASGGFDPIHPGHVAYLMEASRYGELVVIVNGDWFLRQKKGHEFMDLDARCAIVAGIKGVKWVIPYEVEDMTVGKAIQSIKPTFFVKSGDRKDKESIPEWDICKRNKVDIVVLPSHFTGHSSDYLKRWKLYE